MHALTLSCKRSGSNSSHSKFMSAEAWHALPACCASDIHLAFLSAPAAAGCDRSMGSSSMLCHSAHALGSSSSSRLLWPQPAPRLGHALSSRSPPAAGAVCRAAVQLWPHAQLPADCNKHLRLTPLAALCKQALQQRSSMHAGCFPCASYQCA